MKISASIPTTAMLNQMFSGNFVIMVAFRPSENRLKAELLKQSARNWA